MWGQEAALASALAELRGSLERMEKQWGDPLDENSALRVALRAELPGRRSRSREPDPPASGRASALSQDVARRRSSAPAAPPGAPGLQGEQSDHCDVPAMPSAEEPRRRLSAPAAPPEVRGLQGEQSDHCGVPATPSAEEDEDSEFNIAIDRTAGQKFGIKWRVVRSHDGGCLAITGETSGGLVQQWNDNHPTLAVKPGDRIVEVNGIRNDVDQLRNEFNQHKILELRVKRGQDMDMSPSDVRPQLSWNMGRMWRRNRSIATPTQEFSTPLCGVRVVCWRLIHRHDTTFDSVIGLVILVSSIFVGVEIQCDLDGDADCTKSARDLEHVFLAIFILELLIRALADGRGVLQSGWFRFDFILVLMGVCSVWVVEPIVVSTVDTEGPLLFEILSKMLVLRILRLTRLVRAFRLFEQFREMWKLANGLMRSLHTVISACVIIIMSLFVFACLGIELVTRNDSLNEDPETEKVIQQNFPTLPMTMLTLIQFATGDSVAVVYKPIVDKVWYLLFYFAMVWLFVTIILMNLITAVIVDNAIAQADEDREMELHRRRSKLKDLEPYIRSTFEELLGKAGTDTLSQSAFRSGLQAMQDEGMKHLPPDLRKVLDSDHIVGVCEYLDADRSGEIDEGEFVDGIFNLMLQSVPIETTQMMHMLRSQSDTLRTIETKMNISRTLSGRRLGGAGRRPSQDADAAGASASVSLFGRG